MDFGFKIDTIAHPDGIIEQNVSSFSNGMRDEVTKRIINTMEKQVRDSLIELGWSPPAIASGVPCDGYAADLGCDGVAVPIPGRNKEWKQYCAKCRARVMIGGQAWKERVE